MGFEGSRSAPIEHDAVRAPLAVAKHTKSSSGIVYELLRPRLLSRPWACVVWSSDSAFADTSLSLVAAAS